MNKKYFFKLRSLIHSELNLWFSYSEKRNCLFGKCLDHLKLIDFCVQNGFNVGVLCVSPGIVFIYNNGCLLFV